VQQQAGGAGSAVSWMSGQLAGSVRSCSGVLGGSSASSK